MMAVHTTTNKGQRVKLPKRVGSMATSLAGGPTFQELSRGGAFHQAATTRQEPLAPFSGPDAAAMKKKYGHYQLSAQGCIARALAVPNIKLHLNRSQGTAPELVVLGDALLDGYRLGVDLFWQSDTFRDPVFNPSGRPYPVDILKKRADQWFEPVDGVYFHLRDQVQINRDIQRNRRLDQDGHTVVILDTVCQSREMLKAFLLSRGAP